LIVQATESGDDLFQALEDLSGSCSPEAKVILIGQENDIYLYKTLIDLGLSEYAVGGITTAELLEIIANLYAEEDATPLGRAIAFMGARGGVGSSTIAANVAYTLGQQFNEPVILVDLDLAFGTAAMTFDLQARQNVADALADPERLDDVLLEKFLLKFDDHISVMPSPTTLGGDYKIDLEGFEILLRLVRQMASFVVLDMPHQWPPWVSEILLDASEVVVTACPDLVGLRDAKSVLDTLKPKRGVDSPTRLVLNRIGEFKKTELSAKDFEKSLDVVPLTTIPFDPLLFGTAMNNGQMLAQESKGHKVVQRFAGLTDALSARASVGKAKGKSILSFLKGSK
jgi:pilus assembly protein CpaE